MRAALWDHEPDAEPRVLDFGEAEQDRDPAHLRRNNRIQSVPSSLKIEANSLSLDSVRDVLNAREVIGPTKELQEVKTPLRPTTRSALLTRTARTICCACTGLYLPAAQGWRLTPASLCRKISTLWLDSFLPLKVLPMLDANRP